MDEALKEKGGETQPFGMKVGDPFLLLLLAVLFLEIFMGAQCLLWLQFWLHSFDLKPGQRGGETLSKRLSQP